MLLLCILGRWKFLQLVYRAHENKRLATLSKEQLLRNCGALAEAGLSYAALILFGKPNAVARQLPQAEIIFEYRSSQAAGPAAQRVDFCEGFFAQSYNRIWELVNLRNDYKYKRKIIIESPGGFPTGIAVENI